MKCYKCIGLNDNTGGEVKGELLAIEGVTVVQCPCMGRYAIDDGIVEVDSQLYKYTVRRR